jgi:hypothetical protein
VKDVAHKSANDRDRVAFLRIIATSRLEVIHNNLTAALEATHITGGSRAGRGRTLNAQAKSAARSAFESTKQRFEEIISDCPSPWLSSLCDDHSQGTRP